MGRFITGLPELGINETVRAVCVNHTIRTVTHRHYDRFHYHPQCERAFTLWAEHVERLGTERGADVLEWR